MSQRAQVQVLPQPKVRELIRAVVEPLSKTYCYCGAGFYKGIWEYILQRPVMVEVFKSALHGDDLCRIAIHLSLTHRSSSTVSARDVD